MPIDDDRDGRDLRPDEDEPAGPGSGPQQLGTDTVSRLLKALADDPQAPPSAVTADSVLAAARAERTRRGGLTAVPGQGRPAGGRRRTGLVALVAAAAVAGIAAIVIPLSSSNTGSTTTAANSARELAAAAGPSDVAEAAGPADRAGSAGTAAGQACWPALAAPPAEALSAALPPGAFGAPLPLDGGCEPNPVAGAVLPGSVPGTELVVRVVGAEPGACARSVGEAGSRCVASGGDRYVATDPSGAKTVIVYGNGNEVAIGGLRSVDAVPSMPTGLSADQLDAAARALLAALE